MKLSGAIEDIISNYSTLLHITRTFSWLGPGWDGDKGCSKLGHFGNVNLPHSQMAGG